MSRYGPACVRILAGRLEPGRRVRGRVDRLHLDPGLRLATVGRGHGLDPTARDVRLSGVINVRLFAGLRERAGWSQREVEAATVADVWPALGLGDEPNGLLYAVNKEYAPRERELADGDEVAVIPPVSGGAFLLSDEPLSLDRAVDEVRDPRAGAIATFTGTTRNQSRDRDVQYLDYEAYEGMAERLMDEIATELAEKLRALRHRHPPPDRARADRRDLGRDRRLRRASRRRSRGLQGRDRRAEAARAALEERGLRRRRRMDRAGIMSEYRDYEPIQPQRRDWRETIKRAFGPLIAGAIALAKFTFVIAKAGSIFIAVGLYALFFGWWFARRHRAADPAARARSLPRGEARRAASRDCRSSSRSSARTCSTRAATRGRRRASRSRGRSSAGWRHSPVTSSGRQQGSDLLLALAYFGFFLNLFNLIPVRDLRRRRRLALGALAAAGRRRARRR